MRQSCPRSHLGERRKKKPLLPAICAGHGFLSTLATVTTAMTGAESFEGIPSATVEPLIVPMLHDKEMRRPTSSTTALNNWHKSIAYATPRGCKRKRTDSGICTILPNCGLRTQHYRNEASSRSPGCWSGIGRRYTTLSNPLVLHRTCKSIRSMRNGSLWAFAAGFDLKTAISSAHGL